MTLFGMLGDVLYRTLLGVLFLLALCMVVGAARELRHAMGVSWQRRKKRQAAQGRRRSHGDLTDTKGGAKHDVGAEDSRSQEKLPHKLKDNIKRAVTNFAANSERHRARRRSDHKQNVKGAAQDDSSQASAESSSPVSDADASDILTKAVTDRKELSSGSDHAQPNTIRSRLGLSPEDEGQAAAAASEIPPRDRKARSKKGLKQDRWNRFRRQFESNERIGYYSDDENLHSDEEAEMQHGDGEEGGNPHHSQSNELHISRRRSRRGLDLACGGDIRLSSPRTWRGCLRGFWVLAYILATFYVMTCVILGMGCIQKDLPALWPKGVSGCIKVAHDDLHNESNGTGVARSQPLRSQACQKALEISFVRQGMFATRLFHCIVGSKAQILGLSVPEPVVYTLEYVLNAVLSEAVFEAADVVTRNLAMVGTRGMKSVADPFYASPQAPSMLVGLGIMGAILGSLVARRLYRRVRKGSSVSRILSEANASVGTDGAVKHNTGRQEGDTANNKNRIMENQTDNQSENEDEDGDSKDKIENETENEIKKDKENENENEKENEDGKKCKIGQRMQNLDQDQDRHVCEGRYLNRDQKGSTDPGIDQGKEGPQPNVHTLSVHNGHTSRAREVNEQQRDRDMLGNLDFKDDHSETSSAWEGLSAGLAEDLESVKLGHLIQADGALSRTAVPPRPANSLSKHKKMSEINLGALDVGTRRRDAERERFRAFEVKSELAFLKIARSLDLSVHDEALAESRKCFESIQQNLRKTRGSLL